MAAAHMGVVGERPGIQPGRGALRDEASGWMLEHQPHGRHPCAARGKQEFAFQGGALRVGIRVGDQQHLVRLRHGCTGPCGVAVRCHEQQPIQFLAPRIEPALEAQPAGMLRRQPAHIADHALRMQGFRRHHAPATAQRGTQAAQESIHVDTRVTLQYRHDAGRVSDCSPLGRQPLGRGAQQRPQCVVACQHRLFEQLVVETGDPAFACCQHRG